MKVAYIISMLPSGITAWNYREIDILSQNGIEIYAYPLKWTEGPYMPKQEWKFRKTNPFLSLLRQPVALINWPFRYMKLFVLSLKTRTLFEFLLANDYALNMRAVGVKHIHAHFGDRKLFTGYYCSRLLDMPLTVTVHAYELLMNPNPEMFKIAAAHCNKVITVSEFNRNEIHRIFGVSQERINVIHIHGDVSDDRMRESTKLFIAAEFREKKGHEILLKALKKLNRNDITLWIAGRGKLDVRAMAEEIGVSNQCIFLGMVGRDMMNILYDACDIFVLPSRTAANGDREGLPVAIMEAMSHKKPIISTKHVGIPELVPEILIDENEVDGLADAIAYLVDNPEVCRQQGERNYEIIKQEYSENAVLQLKQIFNKPEEKQ